MKRILIISSFYLGSATANGICAKNIAKSLKKEGHDVSVLCYDSADNTEASVYTVPCPVEKLRKSLINKAFSLFGSFLTPSLDKELIGDFKKAALELCEANPTSWRRVSASNPN